MKEASETISRICHLRGMCRAFGGRVPRAAALQEEPIAEEHAILDDVHNIYYTSSTPTPAPSHPRPARRQCAIMDEKAVAQSGDVACLHSQIHPFLLAS